MHAAADAAKASAELPCLQEQDTFVREQVSLFSLLTKLSGCYRYRFVSSLV